MQGCACGARVFVFLRDDQVTLKELSESGLELNGTRIVEPEEKIVESEGRIVEVEEAIARTVENLEVNAVESRKQKREEKVEKEGIAKEGKEKELEKEGKEKELEKEGKEKKLVLVEKEPVDVSKLAWLEEELAFLTREKPVSIDFDAVENLRVVEQGTYELNLPSLMKGDPLVVRSDSGVYYIKLPQPKNTKRKKT